nr:hypothetical protein CFP56_20560 [Quercus suber]
MTLISWRDRRRQSATDDAFRIDDEHNLLRNHRDAYAHLQSFFDHVLPEIINAQAKLYVIGIADGADNLVQFLTRRQEYLREGRVLGVVFVQPMPDATESSIVSDFLAKHGRSWVSSEEPRGQLIQLPERASKTLHWDGVDSTMGKATDIASNETPTSDEQPSSDYERIEPIKPDPVLCPTFSCGFTDVAELTFPSVMDEAVKFLLGRIEQVHEGTGSGTDADD